MMRRLFDRLASPRSPIFLTALSVALLLPALGVGFVMDDQLHRLILRGGPGVDLKPDQVFSTLTGDPSRNHGLIESGVLPWWSAPDLRVMFFRPLSVLAMRLDYALWPESAALMHAHSLAWLALLVAAACALYRRILGAGAIAGLAGLLYAVGKAHAIPAAWLANRNALMAASFGILCLAAHDRARRDGWRAGVVLGPLCLGLSLLSGELGVGTLAYLAAHAAFIDRAPLRSRILALIPSVIVASAWAVVYRALGCGTHGSGLYLDPLGDLPSFLAALPNRALFLLLGQWSPLPAHLGLMPPEVVQPTRWIALVVVGLTVFALVPLVRRSGEARFFCLGMLLSILPCTSTFPHDRMLLFVSLGASGLLAEFLGGLLQFAAWLPARQAWRIPARAIAMCWIFAHLMLAPLVAPSTAVLLGRLGRRLDAAMLGPAVAPSRDGSTLVVVSAPDYLLWVTDLPVTRMLHDVPVPARMRALHTGPNAAELTRLDERTLRVVVEGGWYDGMLGTLFRDRGRPLSVGQHVELSDVSIEVLRLTEDRRPQEVVFHFKQPLDDPSLVWVEWKGWRYVPFTPPEPGRSLTLAGPREAFDPRSAG